MGGEVGGGLGWGSWLLVVFEGCLVGGGWVWRRRWSWV